MGVNRYLGYREALAPAGLDDSRVARMTRPLDERPDLDAMAAGALTVLRDRGKAVPEDIAVVGFNDVVTAQHTQPRLTTVHQPIEALGREMTRMLVRLINGERPTPLILPTELVIRDSA